MRPAICGIILWVAFAPYTCVTAAEPDRAYCELAGYFSGQGDQFLTSVALQGIFDRHLFEDSQCRLISQRAEEIGKLVAGGRQTLASDANTIRKAESFRAKALKFILNGADGPH